MSEPAITFRPGVPADLPATIALYEIAMSETAQLQGVESDGPVPSEEEIRASLGGERKLLIEFLANQPDARFWICESEGELAGYVRVVRFGEIEELAELMVRRDHRGRGVGRALLARCWPEGEEAHAAPRVVVAVGAPADLTLYTDFGMLPVTGHWHMRASAPVFLQRCSQRGDTGGGQVRVLSGEEARKEWQRLEPGALGMSRPAVHSFFAGSRTCLALLDESNAVTAVCWVAEDGNIGPGAGVSPEATATLVIACLERVAAEEGQDQIGVFCTTANSVLYSRLGELGFRVHWPSWVMASASLPALDRYLPTRPPYIL